MCVHVLNAQPQMDSGPSDICCTTGQKSQQTLFALMSPARLQKLHQLLQQLLVPPASIRINAGFSELGFLCQSQAPHSILHTIQHQ